MKLFHPAPAFYQRLFFAVIILLLLLGCSSAPVQNQEKTTGLLWKIQSPTLETDSYLFGTIHSDDDRVTQLDTIVEKAFTGSQQFALEVELESGASQAVALRMYYTDGQTLENVIGEGMYSQTLAVLKPYGLPVDMISIMKPWAAFTILNMPKPGKSLFLDAKLYEQAKASGKKIFGLETLQEQIDVFDQMSINTQISLLQASLDNQPNLEAILDETINVYLSRDLEKMQALNDKYLKLLDEEIATIFVDRLLLQRNETMTERLVHLIKKGPTFVAIGALHLPGEQGVIALLRQQGFVVTPIH